MESLTEACTANAVVESSLVSTPPSVDHNTDDNDHQQSDADRKEDLNPVKHKKTKSSNKRRRHKPKFLNICYSYWNPKPKNKCIGTTEAPIYLIYDDFYANLCDKNEADKNKYSMCWKLIKAYKLNDNKLYNKQLRVISPSIASRDDLLSYHDEDYISLLETVENYPDFSYQTEEEKELIQEYGLIDDCPIFDGLYEYCLNVVGASLTCAQLIKSQTTRIAINFGGGRHHAFASKANGYCYVNDIILCIDSLRTVYNKILYIDLDLHHPDAIQEAYFSSNNVFVASIHFGDPDFFPQTGDKNKFGSKNGHFYNLNIPIVSLYDDTCCDIISKICHRMNYFFQPEAVIICTGCDGLQSDPFNKWNLTINGIAKAVNIIITQIDKPTIVLGGGGYNPIDTAKCWTKIVANSALVPIPNDIPFHSNFNQFAPHYMINKMKFNPFNTHQMQNKQTKKKKLLKMHIHAMQLTYAHLNHFDRLFVENNLKTYTKNKNGVNKSKKREIKCSETQEKEHNDEEEEVEKEEKEHELEHGLEHELEHELEHCGDELLIDSTVSVGDKRNNIATNTCRSRRKRRKMQMSE